MNNSLVLTNARRLRRNMTDAERKLWRCLRLGQIDGHKFRRQAPLGPYIADFVCFSAMLVVELDGGQHADNIGYDQTRTEHLNALGFRVLRFWNCQVLNETEGVLEAIRADLAASSRSVPEAWSMEKVAE